MSEPILRCKMRVNTVKRNIGDNGEVTSEEINLTAVYGNEGTENAQWSKWTPSASFNITISNPAAQNQLARGHEYYVDFTPCDALKYYTAKGE